MTNTEKLTIVEIAKIAAAAAPPPNPEIPQAGAEGLSTGAEEGQQPDYGRGAMYGAAGGAGIGGIIHLLGSLWRGDNPLSLNLLTALLSGGGMGAIAGAGASHMKPGWEDQAQGMFNQSGNRTAGGLANDIKNIDWRKILEHVKGMSPMDQMYGPNVDPSGQNKWDRAGLPTPGGNGNAEPQMYGPNVDSSGQNKWDRLGLPTPGGNAEPIG